ncbi:hypothetical protein EVG20_g4514 [Dentipellis fragilis]|uniref:DH domain-containing protein n=1 Tax=Dentipellis fragilis TaxID=205917 RepID=A0A4Y9YWA6_9AGAM|nr:hypothetical protein EVG20_g4514 [Dentipellis fragilis]
MAASESHKLLRTGQCDLCLPRTPAPTLRLAARLPFATCSPCTCSSRFQERRGTFSFSAHDTRELPDLSTLSLESDEGIRKFQAGKVPEQNEEWYNFVPPEAREAVGKHEVERQSVIFEVFKSEKDYVNDLELVKQVFLEPLKNAKPDVIPKEKLKGFVAEVFGNIDKILGHHQRMLASLFDRQREQHPLVQSVADIVLDNALLMMNDYVTYIKHSPIAVERYRKELRKNPLYEGFIQRCMEDPRIRKRDLKTFLSRPVTRLPRLRLLLERIKKVTEPDHPDLETIPLAMSIMGDLIKSAEPGIVAAEGKVKFWDVCESLVFQKGEIIDMDFYDDSRTLVFSSPLVRKQGTDSWHNWVDLMAVLLDNYFLMLQEETRPTGMVKRRVVSRPIPLEYLRLDSFKAPVESRRDRTENGGGGSLLGSFSASARQELFPFTIHHAAGKGSRRYTLYASTANLRNKWRDAFVDALGVRKVRLEANMWFAPQTIDDGFFRVISSRVPFTPGVKFTGHISCAVAFFSGGRSFIAVGCATGIYVGHRGQSSYRRVLPYASPPFIAVLQTFGKFLVQHESSLYSYSLDLLARAALQQTTQQALDGSMEKLAGNEGSVIFFRVGQLGERALGDNVLALFDTTINLSPTVVYASKSFLQVTLHAMEAVKTIETNLSPRRNPSSPLSYRPYGSPFYVPRDACDIIFLAKTLGVTTEKGIVITNPTNLSSAATTIVPDFGESSTNIAMANLKARCDPAKVLGLMRVDNYELLVVYDELGCYIDRHGKPRRLSGYVRWENKATACVRRGAHVLLFSPEFIEVRNITTGNLVQVIDGADISLLHSGVSEKDILLACMRGDKDDRSGASQKIVELVETAELAATSAAPSSSSVGGVWDEWDMS